MIHFIAALLLFTSSALAHDDASWIAKDGFRNQAQEWCCGVQDCRAIEKVEYSVGSAGYVLRRSFGGDETIPYSEAMPLSIDGRLWICRRPDGSRRCVFDRPPGS